MQKPEAKVLLSLRARVDKIGQVWLHEAARERAVGVYISIHGA